jgi:hypothetical protein
MEEQDRQNRTGRTGQAEQDRQNRTVRTGQAGQDRTEQDRTGQNRMGQDMAGQAGQEGLDTTGFDSQKATARTGQLEKDSQNGTLRTRLP